MADYISNGQKLSMPAEAEIRILNSLQEYVVCYDRNMKILWANSAALNSVEISLDKLKGQRCWSVWAQRETPCPDCPVIAAMETDSVQSIEKTTPDGASWFITGSPLRDKHGKVIGGIETTLDITDRKKAEQALRESEKKYRNILYNIEDGYYEVDIAGNFIFFNDSLAKIFGYSRDEMMGLNSREYTDEENAKKLYKAFNRVYTTGKPEKGYNWEIIRKDGTKRYVEASASLRKDAEGRPIGFQGIVRDITERKQAEQALRESEEKYRTILESIEDGYYEVDLAGNFTFFNDSMCRILGYSKDELMGMNYRQYRDEESAKKVFKAYNRVYRTGKPYKAFDWELIRKDGSRHYVEVSVSLIKDAKGQPVGFFGIARDITERKKAEEEKARLEHQLHQAQKMEAIGTLAGGVAHDLNNVLSGIVGYPDLLLMQLPEGSPLRKPILRIQETGEKAAAIVQDLLTLARRGVATYEVLNLNTVISKYLKSPEYEKMKSFYPDVKVETGLEAGLLNILGAPVHLSKCIMNLVSNSAEAIGEKGKISISTKNRYIDTPIAGYENIAEGDYVTLTVSDSGHGIPPEDIKRIFEPFYTKKKMGKSGTGLGMTVVWGTVKDHKGYIDVKSTEGKGSTFTLYFPVTRQEPSQDQVDLSIKDYMGRGESVLVVDDVKEQRDLVSAMLKTLGYSVAAVSSGEEAVAYLQNNPVDLLVLDMIMAPGMDGLDTYRQVLKLHPGQKAIIASGYSETDRVKEAQRLGAGQYVRKPYTLEKIGMAVKSELAPK